MCETACWLNEKHDARGRRLLADCIECLTRAFPRAGKSAHEANGAIGTDDLVALVGTARRT